MKSGIELAKLTIEKQAYICFEIRTPKGQTVYVQPDETLTTHDAICELDSIAESLPSGRYELLLSRAGNAESARIKKGNNGTQYLSIPIFINSGAGHMDVGSHNAIAHPGINNKEFRELTKQITDLEKKILLLEIENQRLKAEADGGGINGIFNNPHVQNLVAILAQNYMAKNGAANG